MAAQAQYAVADALTLCGVLVDTTNLIWNGMNASERIAGEVFNDKFPTCVDITFSELEDDWKTYSNLTVAENKSQHYSIYSMDS